MNHAKTIVFFVTMKRAPAHVSPFDTDEGQPDWAVRCHEYGKTLSHGDNLRKIPDENVRKLLDKYSDCYTRRDHGPLALLFLTKEDADEAVGKIVEKQPRYQGACEVRELHIPSVVSQDHEIRNIAPEKSCRNCGLRILESNPEEYGDGGCLLHPEAKLGCCRVCSGWVPVNQVLP